MVKDEALKKTDDFLGYCKQRDLNPEDPIELECFKNFIIDHGGSLQDCV